MRSQRTLHGPCHARAGTPRGSRAAGALTAALLAMGLLGSTALAGRAQGAVHGWLNWRGPEQNGVSRETGLKEFWRQPDPKPLWELPLSSRGAPVLANGRLYVLGYQGAGADLQEVLLCANAETGQKVWEVRFNDFLSDIIYDRYSIGAPAVDPETGNVFVLTAAGMLASVAPDGKPVWQRSLMEDFGRLTFPNGRTGGVVLDGELAILHSVTSNWGADGPASDRFYAFDKRTGHLVWSSTPGLQPKDNSFSTPVLLWRNGKRLLIAGCGDGSVVGLNARTGEALWRFPLSRGGVNISPVVLGNRVVAVHSEENLDSSEKGRMVAFTMDAPAKRVDTGAPVLEGAELWRLPIESLSSSPTLVGNTAYVVSLTGQLCAVDVPSGRLQWQQRLGPDNLHSSPLYADGLLFVPLQNGSFHVLEPGEAGARPVATLQLAGNCLGAPIAWNGRIYVTSTERVYCFGRRGRSQSRPAAPAAADETPRPGTPAALQIVPAEALLHPGDRVQLTVRAIDAAGLVTGVIPPEQVRWEKYIPPTARVRSEMRGMVNARGELVADAEPVPSAGAFQATVGNLRGTMRARVLPNLPLQQDFEGFVTDQTLDAVPGLRFAYPPLSWIGARFRFDVRELEGNKVLAKTLDNILFQRGMTFIGSSDMKNYTVAADVMTDGNRRQMSTVGVINQRYLVALLGNSQELEISSNQERLKVAVPFAWQPRVWYRLKTRVDVAADGSGVVRAKAWKRGDPEPEAWTVEATHRHAHTGGSPGLYGFAPQSKFSVYHDNVAVTPN